MKFGPPPRIPRDKSDVSDVSDVNGMTASTNERVPADRERERGREGREKSVMLHSDCVLLAGASLTERTCSREEWHEKNRMRIDTRIVKHRPIPPRQGFGLRY